MTTSKPRHIHHLDPETLVRLHEATASVAPRVESLLAPQVIAERLADPANLSQDGSAWLSPWREARKRFETLRAELSRGNVLVRTDVRDCYGSIEPALLGSSLAACDCDPSDTRVLVGILESLQRRGVRGLPVGPAASSVLANAVLLQADRSIGNFPWLRWVDDFLLFLPDRRSALRALDRLADALGKIGLSLAPEKTSVGTWSGELSGAGGRRGAREPSTAALTG